MILLVFGAILSTFLLVVLAPLLLPLVAVVLWVTLLLACKISYLTRDGVAKQAGGADVNYFSHRADRFIEFSQTLGAYPDSN